MPTARPRNQHFSRVLRGSLDEAEALSLASDDVETTIDGSPIIRGGADLGENEDDGGGDADDEPEETADGGMSCTQSLQPQIITFSSNLLTPDVCTRNGLRSRGSKIFGICLTIDICRCCTFLSRTWAASTCWSKRDILSSKLDS